MTIRNSAMADMNYFCGKVRCSDCHVDEQAGIASRVCHFHHPVMSNSMKSPIVGARNFQSYEYAVSSFSSPDMRSFKQQKCQQDAASSCRIWPTPSQFNVADYDNHDCLSQQSGMFYNGGNSPDVRPSKPNLMLSPMLIDCLRFFRGDATASCSRHNVHSRSPAPVTGTCTQDTSSSRILLSECQGVDAEDSQCVQKQVTLHKWFLIGVPTSDVGTTNNGNHVDICVGGLVEPGTQFSRLVRTSAISERLEKCKLRALDGTEVHLVGCIDERNTIANGFSVLVTTTFLTGFPGNWKYLVSEISGMTPPHGGNSGYCFDLTNCEALSNCKRENVDSAFTRTTSHNSSQVKTVSPVSLAPCPELLYEKQEQVAPQNDFGDGISKLYSNDVHGCELGCRNNSEGKEEGHLSSCPANSINPKSFCETYDANLPLDLRRNLDESRVCVVHADLDYKAGSSELVSQNGATCWVARDVGKEIVLDVTASPLPNEGQGFDDCQDGMIGNHKNVNPTDVSAGEKCNIDTHIEHGVQIAGVDLFPCMQSDISVANVCKIQTDEASHHHGQIDPIASTQGKIATRSQEVPSLKMRLRARPTRSSSEQIQAEPDSTRKTKKSKASNKHTHVQASEPLDPPCDYQVSHHCEQHDLAASTQGAKASGPQEGPCLHVEPVRSPKMRRRASNNRNIAKQSQAELTRKCHNKSSILPPPLPPRRVNVSKDRIMRAYGLKMSRSGRLLVPPLAYWRNQTLAHDMDGTIIAIWEGFVEPPMDTGCYNFKPPIEKTAVNLQEELCAAAAAAAALTPNKSKKKKKH